MDSYAEEFARLAVQLDEQPGVADTVDMIMRYAVTAVGADGASVMLVQPGQDVQIVGVTDQAARLADECQLETGHGPGLAAAQIGVLASVGVIIHDTRTESRWETWCRRVAVEPGIHSVLSIRLGTSLETIGALNLYGHKSDQFDIEDQAVVELLARHAGLALAVSRHEANLWQAIDARKVIGQAQGILMERFDIDAVQAFALLRRYSQHHNVKLREVAQRLITTRRLGPR